MFRDLKEYQTIQKIYEDQILKSPHEDLIIEAFQSEEFTAEEIDYVVNNIDQLCDENLLSEENNDLDEGIGKIVKTVVQKAAPKLVNTAQKASKAIAPGVKAGVDKASPVVKNVASSASKKFGSALGKVKAGLSKAGQAVSKQVDKAKPILKKGLDTAKKVVPAVGALAGVGAIGKRIISGRAAKAETGTKSAGADVDTSSEIESDANYAKSNKNMNKINKFGKSSVPKPVKSPMEAGMGPGAAKARAMAKARIAAKKANPDQKQLSGRERAQAMAKARIAAKKKASQTETKPTETKPTETKPTGTKPTGTTPTGTTPTGGTPTGGTQKTNTEIKKFPGSGKEINPKAKVTQTTSTNDKGQKVTTTTAKTSLQGSEASDAIKQAKERRAKRLQNANEDYGSFDPQISNDLAEIYKNMYNQPVEPENLDEGAKGKVVKAVGKLVGKSIKKIGDTMVVKGGRKVKVATKGAPSADYSRKSFLQSQKEKLAKQQAKGKVAPDKFKEKGFDIKPVAGGGGTTIQRVNKYGIQPGIEPGTKAAKQTGKLRVDSTGGKKATKRTSFQDKDFKPKYENYEPYDIVLEYLLSSEQAATIEEANYIMTEMDAETIQGIVSEGLGSAIKKVVKKGMKKLKGGEMKGDFPTKGDGSYTA